MFVVITIGVVVFRRTQLLPSPISLLRSLRHGRRRLAAATAAIVPVASSWSWSSRSGSSPSSCRRRVTPPLPSSHLLLLALMHTPPCRIIAQGSDWPQAVVVAAWGPRATVGPAVAGAGDELKGAASEKTYGQSWRGDVTRHYSAGRPVDDIDLLTGTQTSASFFPFFPHSSSKLTAQTSHRWCVSILGSGWRYSMSLVSIVSFFSHCFSLVLQSHVTAAVASHKSARVHHLPSLVTCKPTTTATPPRESPARPDALLSRHTRPRHHTNLLPASLVMTTQTRGARPCNRQRGVQVLIADDDVCNDDCNDAGDTRPTTTMVTNARLTMSWASAQCNKHM